MSSRQKANAAVVLASVVKPHSSRGQQSAYRVGQVNRIGTLKTKAAAAADG